MKHLAIFDFDETLINFQTADFFVNFVYSKYHKLFGIPVNIFDRYFVKKKLFPPYLRKKIRLLKLRGISQTTLNSMAGQFYEMYITKNLYPKIMKVLSRHKNNGDGIIILSGSYTCYLNIFCKNHGINNIIATEMEIKNGKLTGFIKGIDCMGDNRLIKFEDYMKDKNYDPKKSYFYSDDVRDLKLFKKIGHKYRIEKGKIIKYKEAKILHKGS